MSAANSSKICDESSLKWVCLLGSAYVHKIKKKKKKSARSPAQHNLMDELQNADVPPLERSRQLGGDVGCPAVCRLGCWR